MPFKVVASLLLACVAVGQPPSNDSMSVIVRFKQSFKTMGHQSLSRRGAQHKTELPLIGASVYEMNVEEYRRLATDPDVELLAPDMPVTATAFSGTLDYGWVTAFNQTQPTGYVNQYKGRGVAVAVIDSGVTPDNDDLEDRVVYAQSFVPGDNSSQDKFGHGSHVAGIIAGNGSSSTGSNFKYTIRGIAPRANIVNLRVLDENGSGKDSTVIMAIERAIALKSAYKIGVINLSLGRRVIMNYANDPLCQAVEKAWKAGIVVVVAAGNDGRNNAASTSGYGTVSSPGNDPYVITVGALNTKATASRSDDVITTYSSKGPSIFDHVVKPDLVAAGNRIASLRVDGSTLDNLYSGNRVVRSSYAVGASHSFGEYFQLSGTSMSAPMVAGAAALIIEQAGFLAPGQFISPDTIKGRLMKTAARLPLINYQITAADTGATYNLQNDIFTVGAGSLDVAKALGNTDIFPQGQLASSPIVYYDTTTKRFRLGPTQGSVAINGVWGDNGLWGDTSVWGDNGVWGVNGLWGDSGVWGDGTSVGYNAIWGANGLWGDSAVTGESIAISINGEN